ncbi:phage antiterminator Q protein [Escherichia coli]|uniref:Phage antiterminator Q protein n=1 Tax=Escherichia coli TaxID=562 RepID=A0A376W5R7_ECOLX|nr:phage antiterminator Q protein [Escherichia coli]
MTRPMCNDDDGMLISQVVDSVMYIDKKAFGILLSYYVMVHLREQLHPTITRLQSHARCVDAVARDGETFTGNL